MNNNNRNEQQQYIDQIGLSAADLSMLRAQNAQAGNAMYLQSQLANAMPRVEEPLPALPMLPWWKVAS